MGILFKVTASSLNLRESAGTESRITAILPRGTIVDHIGDSEVPGWWRVQTGKPLQQGYVARQYLAAESDGALPRFAAINDVIWRMTLAAEGRVSYLLGAKHSSSGRIDCSGWVAELTSAAFQAINSAAAPEVVFHKADFRVLDNHSDGIVTGIEARTGNILKGAQVTEAALVEGMLIGINFADYKWEHNKPPRIYSIDHIVQVVRDPGGGKLYITQSSSSGHGVNKVSLASWLEGRAGLIKLGHVFAVDPFALADRHTAFLRQQDAAAVPQPVQGPGPGPAPAPVPGPAPAGPAPGPAPAPAAQPAAAPAAVPSRLAAFSGRGFYVYSSSEVVHQHGSALAAVDEMRRCRAQHVWLRAHGRGYIGDSKSGADQALRDLIFVARNAGLGVAIWGWNQGEDPIAEARLASEAARRYGVDAYVADIEQDVNGSKWTTTEVLDFVREYRRLQAGPFCVTSHGFIDGHDPELFEGLAAAGVDCVDPQAYWYATAPTQKMLNAVLAPAGKYALHDPASYARLCADRWRRYGLPIVITGQAYAEGDFDTTDAEGKLAAFLAAFQSPKDVIGVNFWHFGATTQTMRDALAVAPPA